MNVSNMVSDAVLAFTGVWVFWRYFQGLSWYNRLLWGFFLLTISVTALVGVLKFAGIEAVRPLHRSLEILAGTLGVVCVVVGVWGLVMRQKISRTGFMVTVALGLALFVILLNPRITAFDTVVSSLAMVVILLIAFLGVLRRDPRSSWIVFAVMILALATRLVKLENLPIHPIDFYHYTLSLSLLCFGKAAESVGQRA
ncbi:DUF6962 family protein [Larkinella soli]|uniref:DUF6962 family protein n=1 Tax=Larkinella soli TaxID=1770527 RepID=UPI000FFC3B1D|nr:hypothetical protein [Larkinella soli]